MPNLKPFTVTVAVFDPGADPDSWTEYVLPVDSPDAEHAVSAAMSNAIAFTNKLAGMAPIPLAFRCTGVTERGEA